MRIAYSFDAERVNDETYCKNKENQIISNYLISKQDLFYERK